MKRLSAARWLTYSPIVWLVAVAILALSGLIIHEERQEGRTLAEMAVLNAAGVLADQVESSFDQANALLASVGIRYAEAWRQGPQNISQAEEQIRREVPNNPLVQRIGIAQTNGATVFNSSVTSTMPPLPSILDRDYFKRAQAGEHGLIFEGPLKSKLDSKWVMILARRIGGDHDRFLGVVFAVIPVDTIGNSFSSVDLGPSGIINLRTANLNQVVRLPALNGTNSDTGNRNVSKTILALMAAHPGQTHYVYETVAPIDGVRRVYAYRKFHHSPFWMTVGRATRDFAPAWQQTAAMLVGLSAVLIGMLLWGARQLERKNRTLQLRIEEKEIIERNLKSSEAQLRTILDGLENAIFLKDRAGHYLFVNAAMRTIMGVKLEDIVDYTDDKFFDAETVLRLHQEDIDVLEHGKTIRKETTLPARDSRRAITYHSVKIPLRDKDGVIYALCGISTDVTDRIEAEARIQQLSRAIEQSPEGVLIVDTETKIEYANPAFIQHSGYTMEELRGQNPSLLKSGKTPKSTIESLWQALTHGQSWKGEFHNLRKDGSEYIESSIISPLRDASGKISHYVAVKEDITEKRRMADEIKQYQEHLEERVEARTRDLEAANSALRDSLFALENVRIGIRWIDCQSGLILRVNRFAAEQLGYREEDLAGMPIQNIETDENTQPFHNLIATMRHQDHILIETVNRTHDGRLIPVEASVHFNRSDATDSRAIVFVTDISERKQAEQTLRQAKETAERANRAKSTFLANMSHEIRTPLNGMLGMASLLRRSGVSPDQGEYLETIDTSGQHLLSIINDILDLSKIEAGKLVLDEQDFNLPEVLNNVVRIIEPRLKSRTLFMHQDISHAPDKVCGDRTRLSQALLNYLGNAVKFTERGGITLACRIEAETAEHYQLRFEVTDTGPGLLPEQQARVFEAFEQADNTSTREHGGTGLGLTITRHIAQCMGGNAGVNCTVGDGCTFWFTARMGKGKNDGTANPLPNEPNAEAQLQTGHSGKRILLAEDDPVNFEVARLLLEGCGLHIEHAINGHEAVSMASECQYDVILMDVQMPVMDGLAASVAIRRQENNTHTPILAMTANAFSEDRIRCIEAGMNDFISKPFEPEALFAMLLKWL